MMMEIRASSFVCRVQCLGKKQGKNPADHMHTGSEWTSTYRSTDITLILSFEMFTITVQRVFIL